MNNSVRRILVVDDNLAIHEDFRKILAPTAENESPLKDAEARLFGSTPFPRALPAFRLDFASDGATAREMVHTARNQGDPYCVIFMDVRMPTAPDGIQTAAQIFTLDPDIQVVLCSAYADYNLEEIGRHLPQSDRFVILKKPFDVVEVRQLANAFAEKWRLSRETRDTLQLLEQTVQQRTAELHWKTALLEAQLNSTIDGVLLVDPQGKIILTNQAFFQIFHIPSDLTGENDDAKLLPLATAQVKDPEAFLARVHQLYAHPEAIGRDDVELCDGTVLDRYSAPVQNPQGNHYGRIWTFRDITERKKAEELLARERDLLQALLDNVPDYVYFKDLQSRYTRINAALARYFGLPSPEAAAGRGDMDFFTLRFERQSFVDEQRIMATGEPIVDRIEEWRSPNGKTNWVSTTKVPLRRRDGQVGGLIGISRDFTPRRLAEERLARTNECILSFGTDIRENIHRLTRLACGLLNARSAVYWHVEGSHLVALTSHGVNAAATLTAHPAPLSLLQELAGKSRDRLQLISRLEGSPRGAQLAEYGLGGFQCAVAVPMRTGEELMGCLILLFPHEIDRAILNDQVLTAVAAAVQVEEERWRATRERQQIEIQLRNAQKLEAIGQLAAGIAHEINTPTQYVGDNTRFFKDSFESLVPLLQNHEQLLQAIKTNTLTPELVARAEQTLAAGDLPYLFEQIPTAIRETLEGIERVTKIVRAMKEFSHPGNREKSLADLNKAIESTVTVARNEWKYVADLELDLDPALPLVPCFLGEFNQAILNLVINAAHAIGDVVKQTSGPKGKITVRTRGEGDAVEVRVTDTGTGIPEAIRPRIFEPFFTTKDVGKGTGQGLSIAYATIVKKHGGAISFETVVGRGTTFIVRLPVKSSGAEPEPVIP